MYTTRKRLIAKAELNKSIFKKRFHHIYYIKHISYGKFTEVYDYGKVQVAFATERIDYSKNPNNKKTEKSLYRVREQIYRIVEGNRGRHGKYKAVFFTLTDRDQQTNIKEANKSIKALMRRLKQTTGYSIKYIIVPERHKSGAIHYHGVFFNLPFIDIKFFKESLWKKGYVDLQLPKKIRSVAKYLSKYLTKDTFSSLPANEKAYFCSRGIFRPISLFTDQYPQNIIKPLKVEIKKKFIKTTYLCKD